MKIYIVAILGLLAISRRPTCFGYTDPRDILAINSLFAALGFPPLLGWLLAGGDPCLEGWQGVQCMDSKITGIVLNDANLGGELGENLGVFGSIIQIDLSNNHIGGTIPSDLPPTVKTFFLSGNQLKGSIPDSLSILGQLTDLSLNNNHLSGVIPDSFQQLTALVNLDLSANNLSGSLPPSMVNLSSISTLHLQENYLTGVLDVLQDLPLIDLDVEDNHFSGPIPPKLLGIPNFRSKGNPFNTTIIPSPPVVSPSPSSPFRPQTPETSSGIQGLGPSSPHSSGQQKSFGSFKVVWIVIGGFLILVLLAIGFYIHMSRHRKQKSNIKVNDHMNKSIPSPSSSNPSHHKENPPGNNDNVRKNVLPKSKPKEKKLEAISTNPKPPQLLSREGVIVKPLVDPTNTNRNTSRNINSLKSFSIASLQQYTNSFSQQNLIGRGVLGTVYKSQLPNGKAFAVRKLENLALRQWGDEDFMGLVSNLLKIKNENIVGLEGYCMEHGQRLLVYEYCKNGTLHEALHLDDQIHEKLSWNARVHLALQAAKALEYLHEICQPLVAHKNFKSTNILLDEELNVRVSDCGLAPLLPSSHITQLQASGYGAPELELGNYTYLSDVYSFGIVMLELLTGRKTHDRSRPRGEQFLVRWAVPRLHDIEALSRMVDPSLHATYTSTKSLSRFADIISLCLQAEPEFRPPMSEIVQNLLHMTKLNN